MSNVVFLGPVVRALLRRTEVCVDSAIFSSVFSPPRVGGRSAGNACALRGTRAGPWSLARCRGESTVERNSETPLPGRPGQCSPLSSIPAQANSLSDDRLVYQCVLSASQRANLVHEPVDWSLAGVEESRDSTHGVKSCPPGGRFFENNSKSI